MKAIFKGETVVRSKLTLDTGLEKLDCSDVSYFAREPKLTHEATKEDGGVILEKDLSFNKIVLLSCAADEVTIDGLTFNLSASVDVNLDEDYVIFYTDACCSVEDADKKEKIEAYHKLMAAYEKQLEAKEGNEDVKEDENDCSCRDGDGICAFCRDDDSDSDEEEKEDIEKKAMDDLDEILAAFFGDVPGFKC